MDAVTNAGYTVDVWVDNNPIGVYVAMMYGGDTLEEYEEDPDKYYYKHLDGVGDGSE